MQKYTWGNTLTNKAVLIRCENLSDEYLWEFLQPEEYLRDLIGSDQFDHWLHTGGGFTLEDEPDPVPRYHRISVWAHHHRERDITWLALNMR